MDQWRFNILERAELDLENLDTQVKGRVFAKLKWFTGNFEYLTPIPLGEPLKGFFKLRVGDWRIVYEIEEDKRLITVHAIDRRDKVYKKFNQKSH